MLRAELQPKRGERHDKGYELSLGSCAGLGEKTGKLCPDCVDTDLTTFSAFGGRQAARQQLDELGLALGRTKEVSHFIRMTGTRARRQK